MTTRTATFVKDVNPGKALYLMDPPHEGHVYVVASGVCNAYAHECYLFASDETGEIVDWAELDESIRNTTDHEDTFERAGYQIVGAK